MRSARGESLFVLVATLAPQLLGGYLFPSLRLAFLAPLIAYRMPRQSLVGSLWLSLLCGLVIDLLVERRFGLFALSYTCATLALYPMRRRFIVDGVMTLPLLSSLFSFLATLFQLALLRALDRPVVMGWQNLSVDVLLMPLFDGLFALIAISLPCYAAVFAKRLQRSRQRRRRSAR